MDRKAMMAAGIPPQHHAFCEAAIAKGFSPASIISLINTVLKGEPKAVACLKLMGDFLVAGEFTLDSLARLNKALSEVFIEPTPTPAP